MNTSITALTETVVENGNTVLAATIITKGPADMAHRIVLRYLKHQDEFVVHLETLHTATVRFTGDPGATDQDCYVHAGYTDGNYFGPDSFARAFEKFTERARRHLDRLQPLHARLGS